MTEETLSILEDVDCSLPWSLITEFSTLPRWKPVDVNGAADRIAKHLAAAQIPHTVYEPTIYLSIPHEGSVRADGRIFRAKPSAYSVSVPEGIEAELVYVPSSYSKTVTNLFATNLAEGALKSGGVAGKIAITDGFAIPGKVGELQAAGAIGVIAINPGEDIHWAICTQIWGTPGLSDLPRKPAIPVVAVNRADGDALIALAEHHAGATLCTRLEEGWFEQKIPVVEIPGTDLSDKFVLLHGHYDSWDVGVGDNATGDASMLEIARVLWKQRAQLRRGVRIAWWPGHSTGRYAGSTWFADKFAIDLNNNCVAQLNCDSPGCRWATGFTHLSLMPETEEFVRSVISKVAGLPIQAERAPRAGDWSFNNIGITALFMLSSTMPDELRASKGYYAVGGCGGNIAWHTENDTLEIADVDILLRDIKIYLAAVIGIANADVLPFDWRATAAGLQASIRRYQESLGTLYSLEPSLNAVGSLETDLEEFYTAIRSKRIGVELANQAIQELARILVPLDHAKQPRFLHDAALPVVPLPLLSQSSTIAELTPELQPFALVDLQRSQNRVVAALESASALVKRALTACHE